jgi:hypothetical protein
MHQVDILFINLFCLCVFLHSPILMKKVTFDLDTSLTWLLYPFSPKLDSDFFFFLVVKNKILFGILIILILYSIIKNNYFNNQIIFVFMHQAPYAIVAIISILAKTWLGIAVFLVETIILFGIIIIFVF